MLLVKPRCLSLPLPGPSAVSTSPQHHAHVTAPPLTMGQSMDPSVGMAAETVSQSLPYSNAHPVSNAQLVGFDIFPERFAGGNPTRVPPDVDRVGMGEGIGEDWNIDYGSAPLLNSGVPGTAGSILADNSSLFCISGPCLLH